MAKTTDELDQSIRSLGVLMETLVDQNKAVLEVLSDVQQKVTKLPKIEDDIETLKSDLRVVKAAVIDTSHQVQDHEHRVTRIEARV